MEIITPTVLASIGLQPYLTTIKWDKGEIFADEPINQGGSGLNPDPFSLLAASLAACTLMTLRMYIDRKNWNVENIQLSIRIDQQREGIELHTSFIKHLVFKPEISAEQINRLTLIANKCPVANTLSGQIQLVTI